jgi:hypothetical protein
MSLDLYQLALRPLLFQVLKSDPELVHRRSLELLAGVDQNTLPLAGLTKARGSSLTPKSLGSGFCQPDRSGRRL